MATLTQRKTAQERRDEIVDAAFAEFARKGLHGTSTDAIARRAGVSQPYLFRLFGTKKELFIAAVNRCFRLTLETFMRAAEGKRGEEALEAIGKAYADLLGNRQKLLMQMQGHVACEDPEICEVVRRGFGEIVEYVERVSGAEPKRVKDFIAFGMLLNVIAAMDLLHDEDGWAKRLMDACREDAG
jgi:AcrR family transcriptional regulator